jgi:hypothetical protein
MLQSVEQVMTECMSNDSEACSLKTAIAHFSVKDPARYTGSLNGAGGIGGLLSATFSATNTVYYSCDANGNVSELVSTDGSISSHYEYTRMALI